MQGKSRSAESTIRYLRRFVLCLCLLALAGWGYELLGRSGLLPGLSGDFSSLFHPTSNFGEGGDFTDLTDFTERLSVLSGPGLVARIAPFNYPPLAAFVMAFFTRCFPNPVWGYVCVLLAAFGVCACALLLRMRSLGRLREAEQPQLVWWCYAAVAAAILLGSPHWFCLARANTEWVPCLLVACGTVCWLRNRPYAAGVFFGTAIACKPYPALFLLLFLWRRQWWSLLAAVCVTAGESLAALRLLGPTVVTAFHSVAAGWHFYAADSILSIRNEQEFRFNHALMDSVKLPVWFVLFHQRTNSLRLDATSGVPLWARMDLWVVLFTLFAMACIAFVAFTYRNRCRYDQIHVLSLLVVLLPFVSAEYTLLLLYLPLALTALRILREPSEDLQANLAKSLLPYAFVLAPLGFMGPFSGCAKTLLLLGTLLALLRNDGGDRTISSSRWATRREPRSECAPQTVFQ